MFLFSMWASAATIYTSSVMLMFLAAVQMKPDFQRLRMLRKNNGSMLDKNLNDEGYEVVIVTEPTFKVPIKMGAEAFSQLSNYVTRKSMVEIYVNIGGVHTLLGYAVVFQTKGEKQT